MQLNTHTLPVLDALLGNHPQRSKLIGTAGTMIQSDYYFIASIITVCPASPQSSSIIMRSYAHCCRADNVYVSINSFMQMCSEFDDPTGL